MSQVSSTPAGETAAQAHTFSVTVNNRAVQFDEHQATGLALKETAIAQGVPIQLDFILYRLKSNGELEQVRDDEQVALNKNREFRAIAPDDNS